MGQPSPYPAAPPSDLQVALMTDRLLDLSTRMTDDQILTVADALHEQLRLRRDLRGRSHDRVERRLSQVPLNMMI